MTNEYWQENSRLIQLNIKRLAVEIKKQFSKESLDDLIQEISLYLYSNCGDLQFNINDVMHAIDMMIDRTRKFIHGKLINDIKKSVDSNLFIDNLTDFNQDHNRSYIDENSSFVSTIIENQNNNSIYDIVIKYISRGYSVYESIKKVSATYNLDSEKIKNAIKMYIYDERYTYQLQNVN